MTTESAGPWLLLMMLLVFPSDSSANETAAAKPLCTVRREIYIKAPEPGAATSAKRVTYVGNGLRRREFLFTTRRSDIIDSGHVRFSDDNGRTWSTPTELPGDEDLEQDGYHLHEYPNATIYDPRAKKTLEFLYQRIYFGEMEPLLSKSWQGKAREFADHSFYRLSDDEGRTWSDRHLLKFEPGDDFDPQHWANPEYLKRNDLSGTYEALVLSDGRIAYPVVTLVPYTEDDEDRRICRKVPWFYTINGYINGVMCFFGTWNPEKNDYDWTNSKPVWLPRRFSTVGLGEPMLAELKNGTLLMDMRGGNKRLDPIACPARRWIATSTDRGKTWSEVHDLRYDSGEQFYSPSAHSRMVRSSKTGKLYWLGNISPTPVKEQVPRYPLYIAEIDEENIALKKDTLTIIDERGPNDGPELQLSNFSVLENRETGDLELFLTRYGAEGDVLSGNAYKYTVTLNE